MNLLSCLKVTQCSTSEIGDAPLYNSCLYRSKLWQQDHCQLPQNANPDGSTLEGTAQCIGRPFGEAQVTVFGVVSKVGHIMPPHIFEVGLKFNTKVYLDVLNRVMIPCLASEGVLRLCTLLSLSPHAPAWKRWTTSFGHTSRTSPTWPLTTPKPAWSPPSAEYSPSSRRRLWKKHAPNSGSVSRRWLRLKAATLNRCHNQVTWIDIFYKRFKIKLKCCFL